MTDENVVDVAAVPEVAVVIFAEAGVEVDALRGSARQAASVTGSLEVIVGRTVAFVPAAAAEASVEHYFAVLFAAETAYLELRMLNEQNLC